LQFCTVDHGSASTRKKIFTEFLSKISVAVLHCLNTLVLLVTVRDAGGSDIDTAVSTSEYSHAGGAAWCRPLGRPPWGRE
jgi:hypothetical protein